MVVLQNENRQSLQWCGELNYFERDIMKKQAILLFAILTVACVGCVVQDSPRVAQMKYDYSQLDADGSLWEQDWEKYKQRKTDYNTKLESLVSRQVSFLQVLDTDEKIKLYEDFIRFITPSNDQIKTYEFIEKLRAALTVEEMNVVMDYFNEQKELESELDRLSKEKQSLELRLHRLDRRRQEISEKWERRLSY